MENGDAILNLNKHSLIISPNDLRRKTRIQKPSEKARGTYSEFFFSLVMAYNTVNADNDVNGTPAYCRGAAPGRGARKDSQVVIKRNPCLKIGTWNARTMLERGKLENVKEEMKRNKLDILGLSEVRWKGCGEYDSDEFRVIYVGSNEGQRGVAFILTKEVKRRVTKVVLHSDRLILIQLKAEPVDITVLQVYMPTSAYDDEVVDSVYEEIEQLVEQVKGNEYLIVMGDFNAVIGEGKDGLEVGEFGLGQRNNRGDKLIEFCRRLKLIITNTWFRQHKRRRYTWTRPDGERYQLDYILVRQRYRNSVKNAHSYPGADINSDHNLVAMRACVRMKKIQRGKKVERLNREKLKSHGEFMKEDVRKKIEENSLVKKSAEEHWSGLRSIVTESARKNIGFDRQKRPRKPWITNEMINKMEERRKWKNNQTKNGKQMYRKLNNELRRETDKARDEWWTGECTALEEMERKGRSDLMYEKIKRLTGNRTHMRCRAVRNKDGSSAENPQDVQKRWNEYIEELYDKNRRPTMEELGIESEDTVEDECKGPPILEDEVREAINAMKNNKAEGRDNIPAEVWKVLGEVGVKELTELCRIIYDDGQWPDEFLKTIMVPIPKKENATECSDYRTISLIPHVSKVMLRILTRRIEGRSGNYVGKSQFGFRKGVGTRDAVGVIRMLVERTLEHDGEIYICFVDFEKAFDRVSWMKMLNILKDLGVDWRDRRLIANLYMRQEVMVRIDGKCTEAVKIGRGVRQGCLISPILFSIYAEAMMCEALEDIQDGIKVGGCSLPDVRFADDQAMMSSTQQGLQNIMQKLESTALGYDMRINTKKTKVMKISRHGGGEIIINVNGQRLERVNKYKYLGTWVTDDGRCDLEVRTRIAMAKQVFSRRKEMLTRGMSRRVKKKMVKTLIWSVALYCAESWTMKTDIVRRLEAFEMWIWRRMERIPWTEKKTNEDVLKLVEEERTLVGKILTRKKNWIGHVLRGNGLLKEVMEGRMEGKRPRGRKRIGMLDELKESGYSDMKRKAENREEWRC